MTQSFDHIINWKLQRGSHEFPGPAGGTCINEAAIVAAGFEYKRVRSWADCPPCFCPVLAQFAIVINDLATDAQRERLMPLVTKLAGSRDEEPWVAEERLGFLRRAIQSGVLDKLGNSGVAHFRRYGRMEQVSAFEEGWRWGGTATSDHNPVYERAAALGTAVGQLSTILHDVGIWRYAKPLSPSAFEFSVTEVSNEVTMTVEDIGHHTVWDVAATALMRAFRIGTQAPVADTAKIVERMEAEKARALERA